MITTFGAALAGPCAGSFKKFLSRRDGLEARGSTEPSSSAQAPVNGVAGQHRVYHDKSGGHH